MKLPAARLPRIRSYVSVPVVLSDGTQYGTFCAAGLTSDKGLTKRDKDLNIIPGLATSWEQVEPTRWRFHLRKGVKFQNGEDFTADDVVFSAERSFQQNSDIKTRIQPAGTKAVKVDDYTVDFVLPSPNPILHYEWDTWYILSKKWAEANGSAQPQPQAGQQMSHAALNANGTGPFIITSHQAGVKTTFKPNPNWWGKVEHNIDEAIFTTVSNDATRVAALLSGDVDWIDPVPLQDVPRINASGTATVNGSTMRATSTSAGPMPARPNSRRPTGPPAQMPRRPRTPSRKSWSPRKSAPSASSTCRFRFRSSTKIFSRAPTRKT